MNYTANAAVAAIVKTRLKSKIDDKTFLFPEQILLVYRPDIKAYSLPGGWLKIGEEPLEAAQRKVLEETGIRTTPTRIVGVITHHLEHTSAMVALVECEMTSGVPAAKSGFHALSELTRIPLYEPLATAIEKGLISGALP